MTHIGSVDPACLADVLARSGEPRAILVCRAWWRLLAADPRCAAGLLARWNGPRALRGACRAGKADMVRLLLAARDCGSGSWAVGLFPRRVDMRVLSVSVAYGILHPSDMSDMHALRDSAEGGHADVVRCMLEQPGLNSHLQHVAPMVLQAAAQHGRAEVLRLLLNAPFALPCNTGALLMALHGGHADAFRLLADKADAKQLHLLAISPPPRAGDTVQERMLAEYVTPEAVRAARGAHPAEHGGQARGEACVIC